MRGMRTRELMAERTWGGSSAPACFDTLPPVATQHDEYWGTLTLYVILSRPLFAAVSKDAQRRPLHEYRASPTAGCAAPRTSPKAQARSVR
jgi:hypothetical protein